MRASGGRASLIHVTALVITGCVLSALVLGGEVSREDRFWGYVTAHSSAAAITRSEALAMVDDICPMTYLEARDLIGFGRLLERAAETRKQRATASTVTAVTKGAARFMCPAERLYPDHPQRDLVAGLPLPGATLDSDPYSGGPHDARGVTYRFPDGMTEQRLAAFYGDHLSVGEDWRSWKWCGVGSEPSEQYLWTRGDRVLALGWYTDDDPLFGEPTGPFVDVSTNPAIGPPDAWPTCAAA